MFAPYLLLRSRSWLFKVHGFRAAGGAKRVGRSVLPFSCLFDHRKSWSRLFLFCEGIPNQKRRCQSRKETCNVLLCFLTRLFDPRLGAAELAGLGDVASVLHVNQEDWLSNFARAIEVQRTLQEEHPTHVFRVAKTKHATNRVVFDPVRH